MTKQSGIGDSFFLNQYDLSGDVGAVTAANVSRALLDVTAIRAGAQERLLGVADGEVGFSAFHNAVAGGAHAVLDTLPRTDVVASALLGSAIASPTGSILGKQVDYNTERGQDGSLVHSSTVRANGSPLEWGQALTAGTVSMAGTATGGTVDAGTASTGAAAYLHLFSITAGTVTVTVQDSTDGSTGWANVSGLSFTATAAATAERVSTTGTVKQYARVSATNPGGGTSVLFVNLVRL